jgi:hypothetical protein
MHDFIIASLWSMGNHLSDPLLVLQHSIALYNCHLAHLQFKAGMIHACGGYTSLQEKNFADAFHVKMEWDVWLLANTASESERFEALWFWL